MHFLPQTLPLAKHSQQSFKQSILVHLQPVCYSSQTSMVALQRRGDSALGLDFLEQRWLGHAAQSLSDSISWSKRSLRGGAKHVQSSSTCISSGAGRTEDLICSKSFQRECEQFILQIIRSFRFDSTSLGAFTDQNYFNFLFFPDSAPYAPSPQNFSTFFQITINIEFSLLTPNIININLYMHSSQQFRSEPTDKQNELKFSYLATSSYWQHLRHTYPHFMCLQDEQKYSLVRNSELFRIKQDRTTLMISYNQPTLSVIVFGQLIIDNKVYQKGSYFCTEIGKTQITFVKKTVIMMLNCEEIDQMMKEYELYYIKKGIIQRILPVAALGLEKRNYKVLCNQAFMVENSSKGPYTLQYAQQEGIYLLYEGTYVLISKQSNTKVAELYNTYIGQQCLWEEQSQYRVQPITYQHRYIWLPKSSFLQVLSQEAILYLKELYGKEQAIRKKLEQQCQSTLKNVQKYVKSSPPNKVQKFSKQEVNAFNSMLDQMSKKVYHPKWRREQEKIQNERQQILKKKRIYTPKKSKSKYFSTLKKKEQQTDYHDIFHQKDFSPFEMKMRYQERVPSKIRFERRSKTEDLRDRGQNMEKAFSTTSFSYYSHNYDRSYSVGMTNLSKMRKYDNLKKTSTLKKGQKIMSTQELSKALSRSFGELTSVLSCKNHKYRSDPEQLFQRTLKRNHLLAKRIMETRGAATWR